MSYHEATLSTPSPLRTPASLATPLRLRRASCGARGSAALEEDPAAAPEGRPAALTSLAAPLGIRPRYALRRCLAASLPAARADLLCSTPSKEDPVAAQEGRSAALASLAAPLGLRPCYAPRWCLSASLFVACTGLLPPVEGSGDAVAWEPADPVDGGKEITARKQVGPANDGRLGPRARKGLGTTPCVSRRARRGGAPEGRRGIAASRGSVQWRHRSAFGQ